MIPLSKEEVRLSTSGIPSEFSSSKLLPERGSEFIHFGWMGADATDATTSTAQHMCKRAIKSHRVHSSLPS
ncbi:unnamed protein product [Victoria cruziana]